MEVCLIMQEGPFYSSGPQGVVPGLAISITWEFIRNENSQNPPRTYWIRIWEWGQESVFQQALQVILNACSSLRMMALPWVLVLRFAQPTLLVCYPECPEASRLCWLHFTPICPPPSLLSLASVLQSIALTHPFPGFSPPVGKHNRLMVKRTVFRGRQPWVEVLALRLIPQERCFTFYSAILSSVNWA